MVKAIQRFLDEHTNAVFCGGVGLGKTHWATALGYAACQTGHPVLFATAVDAFNALGRCRRPTGCKPS